MKIINRLITFLLLPLVIAGAFFAWSLPRITSDYNFNTDEIIYLERSNYWEAYKSLDFQNPIWSQWGSYDQPQLTNYIYAAVPGDRSLLNPENSICPSKSGVNPWSCLAEPPVIDTWPDSVAPVKTMVTKARVLGTAISSLAVATVYLLGITVVGPVTGILAALYFGWYSFFRNISTMAMMDQILLVFLNLQFIVALLINRHKKGNFGLFITLGVLTGLSFSTKLSAAIPTLIIYGYLAIQSLKNKQIKLTHLLFSAILSAALFISLHPQLWSNPIQGVVKMVTWRTSQLAAQQSPVYSPKGLTDQFTYTLHEGFSSWQSGDEYQAVAVIAALALISLLVLSKTRSAFAIISALNLAVFILILPLKWNRYLLPVMPALSIYLGFLPNVVELLIKMIKDNFATIKQFILGAVVAILLIAAAFLLPITNWLAFGIFTITLLLTAQGYLVTRAMLYGFSHRSKREIPAHPQLNTFSLIVPARDEAEVIANTIQSLSTLNYSKDLYEVMVIIRADDYDTLSAAQTAIDSTHAHNIRIVEIDGEAHNKAYSLNIGLHLAKHEVVGIFDAEDEPHKDILQKVNDYFVEHQNIGAVQAPVHLTNVNSTWYSSLNAIEYYYWFKSVLPYLSTKHIVPLGGNTIFTKKAVYDQIGNYDEACLTEDADLGIRLAESKVEIGVIDDANLATKEETPTSEIEIIKQRSRWDQGYLQVLDKSNWLSLSTMQKFYALYVLTQPLFRHLSFLNMIFAPLLASFGHIPLWIVLLSFIPGYFLLLQLGMYLLGLSELAKIHSLKVSLARYFLTILAFVPYQALLTLATFRALGKMMLGNYSWDKTAHTNSHRESLAILE
jgi:cellulose synthase/poly-beta-1,6-N-acetylglucosamine synthase-like glycosyltransferase